MYSLVAGLPFLTRSKATFLLMLVALVVGGCGVLSAQSTASGSGVLLVANRSAYQPGDTALVVLSNRSPNHIGYNLCFSDLARSVGDGWTYVTGPIPPFDLETGRGAACQAIGYVLHPDSSSRLRFPLPDTLSEGTYRIITDVDVDVRARPDQASEHDRRVSLATEPFVVQTP